MKKRLICAVLAILLVFSMLPSAAFAQGEIGGAQPQTVVSGSPSGDGETGYGTDEGMTPGEPTGGEPTGGEPTGEDPTGEDPTGEEPTGGEPTGEEPTGVATPSDLDQALLGEMQTLAAYSNIATWAELEAALNDVQATSITITGNIEVPEGVTLYVNAGVTLQIAPGVTLSVPSGGIEIFGTFLAAGGILEIGSALSPSGRLSTQAAPSSEELQILPDGSKPGMDDGSKTEPDRSRSDIQEQTDAVRAMSNLSDDSAKASAAPTAYVNVWDNGLLEVRSGGICRLYAGGELSIIQETNAAGTVTISETGSRLINDGLIYVYGGTLRVQAPAAYEEDPSASNYLIINEEGTIQGISSTYILNNHNIPVSTFAELQAAVMQASIDNATNNQYYIYTVNDIQLAGNISVPTYATLIVSGGDITIPRGRQLSSTGWVSVRDGYSIIVNGSLNIVDDANASQYSVLYVLDTGTITVQGGGALSVDGRMYIDGMASVLSGSRFTISQMTEAEIESTGTLIVSGTYSKLINNGVINNYGVLQVVSPASYSQGTSTRIGVTNEGGVVEGIPSQFVFHRRHTQVFTVNELNDAVEAAENDPNTNCFIHILDSIAITDDLDLPSNAILDILSSPSAVHGELIIRNGATLYAKGRIYLQDSTLLADGGNIVMDAKSSLQLWYGSELRLQNGAKVTLYPGSNLYIGVDDEDSCILNVASGCELRQYGYLFISRYSTLNFASYSSLIMHNGSQTAIIGTLSLDGWGQCDQYAYVNIGQYGKVVGANADSIYYYSPGTVSIAGTPTIGSTLTAKATGFTAGTLFYQWYASGNAISGANASTYTIPSGQGMAGKRISVSVTSLGYDSIFSSPTAPIAKAIPARPAKPVLQISTHTSVALQPVPSAKYICTTGSAIPAISASGWQDSNEFTGLTPYTTYYFYLYIPASSDYTVSPVSVALPIRTLAQPIESIVISGPQEVAAGKSIQLSAAILPANAGNKTLSWLSSDQTIATVSGGKVTAKSVPGTRTVTITAQATDQSGLSDTYEITVKPVAASVIISRDGNTVTGKTLGIDLAAENKTIQLSAIVKPDDAAQGIVWSSSNARVAQVSSDGLVTGIAKGIAAITAATTDGSGVKAIVNINVATMVKTITISGPAEVAAGRSIQLTAAVGPADATNKNVIWSSSDMNVATVSSGKVTAKKIAGTQIVTITATAADGSGILGRVEVTVKPAAASVIISRDGSAVTGQTLGIDLAEEEKTLQLTASVNPVDAGQGILWTTSSAKVATVTQDGLVTGVAQGKAIITATATDGSGVKAIVYINVATMVKNITITGSSEVAAGKSIQLATIIDPYGATTKSVIWSSSNQNAATISKTGTLTAKKILGTQQTTITATATDGSGAYATYEVTVRPAVTSVVICKNDDVVTGKSLGIDLGPTDKTIQLTAATLPDDAGQGIQWTTSSAKVATITQDGLVTGIAQGKAIITATAKDGTGVKATVIINVATLVKDIDITGPLEVAAGRSIQLTAVIGPANATNKSVIWSSSDSNVATVSAGRVTAKKIAGTQTVRITATAADGSGITEVVEITVKPAATAVNIFSGSTNVTNGILGIDLAEEEKTLQLTASVNPVDAGQGILWTTSNAKVATITQDGLVTGVAQGKAIITATAADGTGVKSRVIINVATLVKDITITGPSEVGAGKSIPLQAIIAPYEATTKTVQWVSSDTNVATVSSSGIVTAKSMTGIQAVTVTITATAADGSGKSKSHIVTVRPMAATVIIRIDGTASNGTVQNIDFTKEDKTIQLTTTIQPDDSSQGVIWYTSSARIATVSQSGLITGIGIGKAVITAAATDGSGRKASITVNVLRPVKELTISGPGEVTAGNSIQLTAAVGPADATNKIVVWKSSNTNVATVSSSGRVIAKSVTSAQTVTITATAMDGSGFSSDMEITVNPA